MTDTAVRPAGALLERQLVFFSPRIGLLTTAVLAMIPMLRPFAWQSMLMPVLPAHDSMLHLLEAPVPFILGMQVSSRVRAVPRNKGARSLAAEVPSSC